MVTVAERARQADALRVLHHAERPLVLANAWDAKSARLVVAAGFPVVATSSGALVTALGYEDGSNIPVDDAFAALARIAGAVEVPVTADIEDGYGLSADELAGHLLDAGAVGCNLEDSDHGPTDAPLVPAEQFAERVAALKAAAVGRGVDLVINARVDVHLRQVGPPEDRLEEALRRSRLYLAAGAACVYPIAVSDEETARALVAGTPGPVNLMARPDAADVVRLASFGVARISVGSGLSKVADQRVSEVAGELARALSAP
jgi:2-methylisocitrate lyase-like PEP mutase family enzyme